MSLKVEFAKKLKEIRKLRGYTQEELAELVNVAPRHISFIETARSFPSSDLIERISNALNVRYCAFFDFREDFSRDELTRRILTIANKLDMEKLNFLYKMASEL